MFPPPDSLLTVAQALRSASLWLTPAVFVILFDMPCLALLPIGVAGLSPRGIAYILEVVPPRVSNFSKPIIVPPSQAFHIPQGTLPSDIWLGKSEESIE